MNKIIILIIPILLTGTLFAQNDTIVNDSCRCKNEFSLNVIPVFSEIMTGDAEYQKFSLIYKRKFHEGALRIQAFYIPEYSFYYLYDQLHYSRYEDYGDTLRKFYLRNISSYCFGGAIGYEWQKAKKHVDRFIGFDVSFGVNNIKHHTKISNWLPDSTNNDYYEHSLVNESKLTTTVMRIGINPFYGWKLKIEDQFSLSIQFGPDFGFYFGDIATLSSNYDLDEREVSDFYFSKFFLNDVSVVFKF